eukprot:12880763-Prorocentrum_lima.AAC.1
MERGRLQLHCMWRNVHMQQLQDHGETHSEESSGSHQEPEEDAGFYDVNNDFKLPLGIVPEPGFRDPKNHFKLLDGPAPDL